MRRSLTLALCALIAVTSPALAQEGELPPPGESRLFGFEFEFAGQGNRIVDFEQMPFENFRQLMAVIVEHYGGDAREIRRVNFTASTTNLERYPTGERPLFRAEWTDGRGRVWQIVPEFVASSGYDGYEVVTPPMDDPRELERVLEEIRGSGLVREGVRSGTHLTIDGRSLVAENGNARALTNLIMLHENLEPLLRRMFNPVRHGGETNRFARSLAADHPGLLEAIDRLPPERRTTAELERIFEQYDASERRIQEVDAENASSQKKPWKYRSMNLSKILDINPLSEGNRTVEFRMLDLADAPTHRAQAEVYRALVRHAERLAEQGIDVRHESRQGQPGSQTYANTPGTAAETRAEARELLETLGLEPSRFEQLLERNVQPRSHATLAEVEAELERIGRGRPTNNGQAFTYGFELEGRGAGLTGIFVPTDAEVANRWDDMSKAQKRAYYERVVGNNHSSVKTHFKPDARVSWLDPYWYVEATGNWEIHSKVFESPTEAAEAMRAAKRGTQGDGKGFHLHMRDNGGNLEALKAEGTRFGDFMERAANWVWLERARRMRSDLSLKSWSNKRPTRGQVDNYAQVGSSQRATIRTGIRDGVLDIEIRGLVTWVDDIERLAKVITDRLQNGQFGPWHHTDNPLETNRTLTQEVERYLAEVEGRELTPETRRAVELIESLGGGGSRGTEYKRSLVVPLLAWENEASISESTRRELRFAKEDYLRSVATIAQQIAEGRFGPEENLNRKEIERVTRLKVKRWANNTTLAEALFASLLAPPTAEREAGFAPPRTSNSTSRRRLSNESAREVFEEVRRAAIERAGRGLEFLPPGVVSDAMRESQRRLGISELEIVESRSVDARTLLNGRVRVTTGLLQEIDNRARSLPASERPAFRRRALGLIFGHELAHVRGNMNERLADAEAVRTVNASRLARIDGVTVPLSEAELRETLRVFERPTRLGRLYQSLRSRPRYGTFATRLRNLIATSRTASAPRGLPIPGQHGSTDAAAERAEQERLRERAERAERTDRETARTERSERETTRTERGYERPTAERGVGRSLGVTGLLEGRTGRAAERGRERERPRR